MNEIDPQSRPIPVVPKEAAAILESTFQRILAEATFADTWPLSGVSDADAVESAELRLLLPMVAPWKGSILIGATEATAKDLAAGFHSLPDAMVDQTLATEFLAELAEMLARDLFCASEIAVQTGAPSVLEKDSTSTLWSMASGSRTTLGCNGTGRMIAALVATTG